MNLLEQKLITGIIKNFIEKFFYEINELKTTLKTFGMDIAKGLPYTFNAEFLVIRVTYSVDRKQALIRLEKSTNKSSFVIQFVQGNVFQTVFYNFMEVGEGSVEIYFQDIQINDRKIDYAFCFSLDVINKKSANIKDFAKDFVFVHWDYYKSNQKNRFIVSLEEIKNKMEYYFFNADVKELEIDKFIEENPIILERGLDLVAPRSQVILKDVQQKYGQDLKPDVIAYDERNKIWTIVDYKRNERNLMKNVGNVRAALKSEVISLRSQLRDYKEYFEEERHRAYVKKKYKLEIIHPTTIGIIGKLLPNEEQEFNRLMKDEPRWFSVVPYNYLYEAFCRYVDLAIKTLNQGN